MWSVWPDLPLYGSKAIQFVDLLGYFTIKTPQTSERRVLCLRLLFLCEYNIVLLRQEWLRAVALHTSFIQLHRSCMRYAFVALH